jgi:hypothetical protein
VEIPPIEWLLDVSDTTLMDLQLAALNRSAKHTKAAKAEMAAAITQAAIAEVAQYMRENRKEMLEIARRTIDTQAVISFPERKRA